MNKHIEQEQSAAHRGFSIVIERVGASIIRQALDSAIREQELGNAGVVVSDENEEEGRRSSYVLSIRDNRAYAVLYFSLPVSAVAEMLPTPAPSPE